MGLGGVVVGGGGGGGGMCWMLHVSYLVVASHLWVVTVDGSELTPQTFVTLCHFPKASTVGTLQHCILAIPVFLSPSRLDKYYST